MGGTQMAEPPTDGGDQGGTALGSSDGEAIAGFLDQLRAFMSDVIEGDLLPGDLVGEYREVFLGLDDAFALAIAQLQQPGIEDHLRVAGLVHLPRTLKLGVFEKALDVAGRLGNPLRAVRAVLGAANVILGSLLMIPGVEPIKEFKETLEVGIDIADIAAS